nr:hypothetical protein Iba_scaffold68226CG0010 [Ipomoea batatas]
MPSSKPRGVENVRGRGFVASWVAAVIDELLRQLWELHCIADVTRNTGMTELPLSSPGRAHRVCRSSVTAEGNDSRVLRRSSSLLLSWSIAGHDPMPLAAAMPETGNAKLPPGLAYRKLSYVAPVEKGVVGWRSSRRLLDCRAHHRRGRGENGHRRPSLHAASGFYFDIGRGR